MPDGFEIIKDTSVHTGSSSGFMKLSNSAPTFSVFQINGKDIADTDLLPEDTYILGNVTKFQLSSGAIAIWRG